MEMSVAVLGASNKPDRYSYKALTKLREHGFKTFPIHPVYEEIDGIKAYKSLDDITEPIDTITIYLSAANSTPLIDDILKSGARRVIFNPGTENNELSRTLKENGIEVVEGCTLVMLSTGQF